jgi:arsenate reductase
MNKITIWHNPRCRKSREGLAFAEKIASEKGLEIKIVKYLIDTPSEKELSQVLKTMQMKPIALVRTKEAIWKENYKGKELSDTEIIKAMVKNPKLIERPIVIYKDKAVMARPAEKVAELF